ncbi:hypothetical protein Ancab_015522 [Ancistrocladus abbreviatus]
MPSEKKKVDSNFLLKKNTATLSLGKRNSGRKDFQNCSTSAATQKFKLPRPLFASESAFLGPSLALSVDNVSGLPAQTCPKLCAPEGREDSQRASSCPFTCGPRIGRMGRVGNFLAAQKEHCKVKKRHRLLTSRKRKPIRKTGVATTSSIALPRHGGPGTSLQGLSIGDSCIENRNCLILEELEQVQAEELLCMFTDGQFCLFGSYAQCPGGD